MAKRVKFHDTGERLTKTQLGQIEFLLCPEAYRGLPADYQKFLLKYNGGRPEPAHFKWRDKDGEEQEEEVDEFLGIDPGRLDEPGVLDCVRATMHYRWMLPRHAVLIAQLHFHAKLVLFTAGPREGQVWHWSDAGIGLEGSDFDPDEHVDFVAKSFGALLKSLYEPVVADPYAPVTIALDSPRVRGQRLAEILKSLGCTKWKYPGVTASSRALPPAWRWPKYPNTPDPGGPAFLSVERNKTVGYAPDFDERPKGHKMLLVNVTAKQRAQCIRELTAALGEGAVVLDGA